MTRDRTSVCVCVWGVWSGLSPSVGLTGGCDRPSDSSVWVPGCNWGAPGTLLAHLLNPWEGGVCHWAVLLSQHGGTTKSSRVKASLTYPSLAPPLPSSPAPSCDVRPPPPQNEGLPLPKSCSLTSPPNSCPQPMHFLNSVRLNPDGSYLRPHHSCVAEEATGG